MSPDTYLDAILNAQSAGRSAQASRLVQRYARLTIAGKLPPISQVYNYRFERALAAATSPEAILEARKAGGQLAGQSIQEIFNRGDVAAAKAEFDHYISSSPRIGDFMRAQPAEIAATAKPWVVRNGGKLAIAGAVVASVAAAGLIAHKVLQKPRWSERVTSEPTHEGARR